MNIDALSNLVITKIHAVSTLYNPANTRVRRKDRQHWAVVIKYEGETVYTWNGKQILSDINHIVLLPKGCTYDWECTRSGAFSIIEFDANDCLSEPMVFFVKNSEKLLKMFQELEYKRSMKRPMAEAEGIRDTYSILLLLVQSNAEPYLPTEKQRKIAPVLEYISQHYNEPVTNEMLATVGGMSTVYFRKLFTSVIGVSPIAYARGLRIERAREMLKSDYGTLSDVAQSLGYASLYDFSRDFKKHTGVAPSKYAEGK